MRSVLVIGSLALVVGCRAHPASADDESSAPLQLSDFAYSQVLSPSSDRALQTAIIPLEVYRGALRKSLADVRVFDPEGEEVPHAIRRLAAPTPRPRGSREVPIFPLTETPDGEPGGELSIHIERDSAGEVIDIRSALPSPGGGAEPAGRIVSYILDARGLEDPIVELIVRISDPGKDYVLPVELETSENLEDWSPVLTRGPLVRLDFEGNRIEHDEVLVVPTKAKYLRLSWPGHELPASITAVVAETQPVDARPIRVGLDVLGKPVPGETDVYLFDADGFVPADSVQLRLLEENDLVKGELTSSDDESGPWDPVMRGRFYRIVDNGQEILQPPQEIVRRAPRFWRLEVTAGKKKRGRRLPVLRLTFLPDQLLFVSRGTDDHLLAYGSYKASAPDFDESDLVELVRRSPEPLPRETAALGPQRSVTGAAALEEPPPPPPIRTYILWAVLILASLILAVFAARLLRQPP